MTTSDRLVVTRADDDRAAILGLRDNATTRIRAAGLHVLPTDDTWIPAQDPHREAIRALAAA